MSIAIVNQKGGVGKTTAALHLALYAAETLRVLVVDMDRQANTTWFFLGDEAPTGFVSSQLFTEAGGNGAEPLKITDKLSIIPADRGGLLGIGDEVSPFPRKHLAAISGFDLIVIDTPPAQGGAQSSALAAASCYLTPIGLDKQSEEGLKGLLLDIRRIRSRFNPRLAHIGILANRFNTRSVQQRKRFESLLADYGERVLPVALAERAAVSTTYEQRIPVWQGARSGGQWTAGREMRAVCKTILGRAFQ